MSDGLQGSSLFPLPAGGPVESPKTASLIRADTKKLRPGSELRPGWSTYRRLGRNLNLGFLFSRIFVKSFAIAGAVGLTAAGIQVLIEAGIFHPAVVGFGDSSAFGHLTFLVGIVLSLRTSQAYNRYWDGCLEVYKVQAEWHEACSSLLAFVKRAPEPCSKVEDFKQMIVRLFSLMFAQSLADISENRDQPQSLELLDPYALDPQSLHDLKCATCRRDLVSTWIYNAIMQNMDEGILICPPPILSRVFQELSNGAVALHHAAVVSRIPFPNAYTQACNGLVMITTLSSAFLTHGFISGVPAAFFLSFAQAFFLWTLNLTAYELCNPFGSDDNDVDMGLMQRQFNQRLKALVEPKVRRAPGLVLTGARGLAARPIDQGDVLNALYSEGPQGRTAPIDVVRSAEAGVIPEADIAQAGHSGRGPRARATPGEPTEQSGHAPVVLDPERGLALCSPPATSSGQKPAHGFAVADTGPGLAREDSEDTLPTAVISAGLPAQSSSSGHHADTTHSRQDSPRASQHSADVSVASVAKPSDSHRWIGDIATPQMCRPGTNVLSSSLAQPYDNLIWTEESATPAPAHATSPSGFLSILC